jgi:hypothetical protein
MEVLDAPLALFAPVKYTEYHVLYETLTFQARTTAFNWVLELFSTLC